jgi:hypothetical protein
LDHDEDSVSARGRLAEEPEGSALMLENEGSCSGFTRLAVDVEDIDAFGEARPSWGVLDDAMRDDELAGGGRIPDIRSKADGPDKVAAGRFTD